MNYFTRVIIIFLSVFFSCSNCGNNSGNDYGKDTEKIIEILHQPKKIQSVPKPFRIIALSFASEGFNNLTRDGIMKQDDAALIFHRIVKIGISRRVSPLKRDIRYYKNLPGYNLYYSHLSIILSNLASSTGSKKYYSLHKRINKHLLDKTMASKNYHLQAYPSLKGCYVADQAALLYSLKRYDGAYGNSKSKTSIHEIVEKWLSYIRKKGTHSEFGLPVSEVNGVLPYSMVPRGCAVPYTIYYLRSLSRNDATKYWHNFKKHFKGDLLGYTLFREWPKEVKNKWQRRSIRNWNKKYAIKGDPDSGPMIMEYGAAATGLSLLGARAVNDNTTYNEVKKSVNTGISVLKYQNKWFYNRVNNFLSLSIQFAARTMR
jgi:hypothetical protein